MSNETKSKPVIPQVSSFPGSKKVYIQGSRPDIQVPMREITLSPTTGAYGEQENAPIRVYDTSDPIRMLTLTPISAKGFCQTASIGYGNAGMSRNMKEDLLNRKIMVINMENR